MPSDGDVERALAHPAEPGAEIDLRVEAQLELLSHLADHAHGTGDGPRYVPGNPQYGWSDAAVYRGMLATHRPKRVIEVGSGHSSAQALDTADAHGLDTSFTFIDPYPERLLSTLTGDDRLRTQILVKPVQEVDHSVFERLEAGDFLFIDSTHVAKAGSDVNHLYLSVLPRLAPGVWVHIHDIFWPFEYPREWYVEGRAWNELYLLRAFLVFSSAYRIELFCDFLARRHPAAFEPFVNTRVGTGQGAIWLRRT